MTGLLIHRATIQRNTPQNVEGVVTPSLADLATNVRCLVQEELGRVTTGPAGLVLAYDAIGFFPRGTDLRPKGSAASDQPDVVVVTDRRGSSLGTFTVLHVGDEAGMGHHLTAKLKREGA